MPNYLDPELPFGGVRRQYGRGESLLAAGQRVTFKHLAAAMIFCALMVAGLNVYMNVAASRSLPSLQLDMSPDGDLIGFHHPAQGGSVVDRDQLKNANQFKSERTLRAERRAARAMKAGMQPAEPMVHHVEPLPHVDGAQPGDDAPCAGLCPPVGSPQSQKAFVADLIGRRLRNLPPNTFSVEKRPAKFYENDNDEDPLTDDELKAIWKEVDGWTHSRALAPHNLTMSRMRKIIRAAATAPIDEIGAPKKGTQLKLAMRLRADQYALWKPELLARDRHAPTDTPFAGPDRHGAEIAAFYLSILLQLPRTPVAVGRTLNVVDEILPKVMDPQLNATFYRDKSTKNWCFYGKCHYCKPSAAVCADRQSNLPGALLLWNSFSAMERIASPWIRSYEPEKSAVWENNRDYCELTVRRHALFGNAPMYLDAMDAALFDWIVGNADRHHVEIFHGVQTPMILLLDNGKGFRHPDVDELSILAPIYQCCQVRSRMYQMLLRYSEVNFAQLLNEWLALDPTYPVLSDQQLAAVNRRLRKALILIAACIEVHGADYVLQDDQF